MALLAHTYDNPPTRRQMVEALLVCEDLLPSSEWPWTTERLREAYEALRREDAHA